MPIALQPFALSIMAIFLISVVLIQGKTAQISDILSDKKALTFIGFSGIAGALSWLFYFLAIQVGPISKVVSIDKLSLVFSVILVLIIFQETLSLPATFGVILIAIGALLIAVF